MSEEQTKEPMRCKGCGTPFSLQAVADAKENSSVVFAITPKPGALMAARTVGGTLDAMGKLIKAVGEDIGAPTVAMVQRIVTRDDGTIEFHLLIARTQGRPRGKKKTEPPQ